MRARWTLVVMLALLAGACSSTLGRTMPECEETSPTMVLAVQSVPGAAYVSCIDALRVGWDYDDLEARQGKSTYTLDSDRMGSNFITVSNQQSCDVGSAALARTRDGVELWKNVVATTVVDVVIVPEGPTNETSARAAEVAVELNSEEIRGRVVAVTISASDATTAERIEVASRSGAHVIVVGIRDVEEDTLGLLIAGTTTEVTVDDIDEATEAIEDAETESSYTGSWFYVFDGGCVVYEFDASGPGTATIEEDIQAALGLFDAEELREVGRDAGFRIP